MTDTQIKAVMHHLFDCDESGATFGGHDEFADNMWRRGDDWPVPVWLGTMFGLWLTAFRDQDWAELAQWMPPDEMGQYAKLKARNRHLAVITETRELCDSIRTKKRCSKAKAIEDAAVKLNRDVKTVDERLTRLKHWEKKSKLFWSEFLAKNR